MNFDLRLPLGLIFAIFGALLTAYGALGETAASRRFLGTNIDLVWGVVMLVFAVAMLFFAFRARMRKDGD